MHDHFRVGIGSDDASVLAAGPCLDRIRDDEAYFAQRGYRHPLAIYNVSISRLTYRGTRLSEFLYRFFSEARSLKDDTNELLARIDEQLELFVYALDAHVDDCELILKLCFRSDRDYAKSKAVRDFKGSIKSLRRPASVLCNAFKHNHQRIRFFESEFHLIRGSLVLLGFFLERADAKSIHPDPNFLGPGKSVISCVGFLWSSLVRVLLMSSVLNASLQQMLLPNSTPTDLRWDDLNFRKLLVSVGYLPLYTFDDEDPFDSVTLTLDRDASSLVKPLLASFFDSTQSSSELLGHGSNRLRYDGDGVSKTFSFFTPAKASFHSVRHD